VSDRGKAPQARREEAFDKSDGVVSVQRDRTVSKGIGPPADPVEELSVGQRPPSRRQRGTVPSAARALAQSLEEAQRAASAIAR
jgi:hypothetical protein